MIFILVLKKKLVIVNYNNFIFKVLEEEGGKAWKG